MSETATIRVTLTEESIEKGRGLNPVALNEPELVRFFFALGLMKASNITGEGAAPMPDLEDMNVEVAEGDVDSEAE